MGGKHKGYSNRSMPKAGTIIENGWLEEIRARRLSGERAGKIAEDYDGVSTSLVGYATKDIPDIEAIRNKLDRSIRHRVWKEESIAATVDRFWGRVAKSSAPDGCWEWTGNVHAINRYGRMSIRRISTKEQPEYTHRFSYYLSRGRWPKKGTHIAHKCDNPCCVRPDHLYEATPRENHYDSVVRNGKKIWRRKLSNKDVKDIINRYQSIDDVAELSEEYGVTTQYIYMLGLRNHSRAANALEDKGPNWCENEWSPEEDAILIKHYASMNWRKIGDLLENRTPGAIRSHAMGLGLRKDDRTGGRHWWELWEDTLILENYPSGGSRIPQLSHRTKSAIRQRARRLRVCSRKRPQAAAA